MSFFYCGVDLHDFLFEGLNTVSGRGLFGICVMITVLALGHEGLHVLKRFFLTRFLQIRKQLLSRSPSRSPESSDDEAASSSQAVSRRRRHHREEVGSGEPAPRSLLEESDHHEGDGDTDVITQRPAGVGGSHGGFLFLGISSVLHSIYMFLGFTLMNAVMSFNAWILIAVGIGVAIGYFLFGNYRREDILIRPLSRETTSTNDESGAPSPPNSDENLRTCINYGATSSEGQGESSRLVVGAQVHSHRIILGSTPT